MRTRGIPAVSGEPLSVFRTDQVLKQHSAYKLAKSGDPAAALELVSELAVTLIEEVRRFGSEMIFVAPHALEAGGENAIPQTLAAYLAHKSGSRDDTSIVQRNRVYHTGADAMQRLIAPELLERRFGNEIRATFGIEPAALTWEESQYLVGFRTVDELRNRAAAAKQARVERLRSKGIDPERKIGGARNSSVGTSRR
jgi:hypothetical protein